MRTPTLAILGLLIALTPQAAAASELFGTWMTTGGRSKVEVRPCGDSICANIIWLKNPNNDKGEPLYDKRNEAAELRDRPIIGILILKVAQAGDNLWKGRVYDPERGKTYPAEVTFVREDVLQVTGCGLGGLVCKSKNWTKVALPAGQPAQIQASPAPPPTQIAPPQGQRAPQPSYGGGYGGDSGLKPYPPR